MVDKELVKELYAATRSHSLTARILHRSKQRICQIIKQTELKELLVRCIICHEPTVIIRRIDDNLNTRSIDDMIPLCLNCERMIDESIADLSDSQRSEI